MSTHKPSREEDEFFAKEEAARLHALAVEHMRKLEGQERDKLREAHWMRCPKCGYELKPLSFKGVNVDRCFHCSGTWLDAGELEQLAGKESDLLSRIVAVFKRG